MNRLKMKNLGRRESSEYPNVYGVEVTMRSPNYKEYLQLQGIIANFYSEEKGVTVSVRNWQDWAAVDGDGKAWR